jgi:hypothetical protein
MSLLDREKLEEIGFEKIGHWTLVNDVINYVINDDKKPLTEVGNALYSFVCGDEVKYIGKTTRGISKRFVGYVNPGDSQSTNIKCNKKIKELLSNGNNRTEVKIWVYTPTIPLQISGFYINLAAGLEDSLIDKFKPEWNGKNKIANDLSDNVELIDEQEESVLNNQTVNTNEFKPLEASRFTITLGNTYYNQGFINPGVGVDDQLGYHGEEIRIILEDRYILSKINRNATPAHTVRIQENVAVIARWFQTNFNFRDTVTAYVIDRHTIWLRLNPQ